MSLRNYRKLCNNSSLPPAEDESHDVYEPLYVHNTSSLYKGLVLSSESEMESPVVSDEESKTKPPPPKPQKKKSKKKGGKTKPATNASNIATMAMDEIDKSVLEVNALLGALPTPSTSSEPPKPSPSTDPMSVSRMHLNINVELKRLFGPNTDSNRRVKSETYLYLLLKRVLVLPMNETIIYDYKKNNGLSMSINRRENDVTYFTFDHSQERQKFHHTYVKLAKQRKLAPPMPLEDTRNNMHIEGLLELSEALFRLEEYSLANEIIENVIAYMQYVAHPSFNLASANVRLEYKFWENRPFHVATLKFIYLLTNKACHRTALELAKMLLNIDPSDPLAVLFIIDGLAIRAREHEWLIEAIKYFGTLREAKLLFNMQYSHALALFHVATKNRTDTTDADLCVQEAILAYPMVVTKIFEFAGVQNERIRNHELFTREPHSFATDGLNVLMFIYAKLTYSRYRESNVLEWFLKNVIEVINNYNNSEEVRIRAKEMRSLRHGLFQMWPPEVMRHLGVVKHMSKLVFEAPLPRYDRQTCGWDPLQDGGINRYSYKTIINPPYDMGPAGSTLYSYDPLADGPFGMRDFEMTPDGPRINGHRPEHILNTIMGAFEGLFTANNANRGNAQGNNAAGQNRQKKTRKNKNKQ